MRSRVMIHSLSPRVGSCGGPGCHNLVVSGKAGPARVTCSQRCQSARWRADHRGEDYLRSRSEYRLLTEEGRDLLRARARARSSALSELGRRYPDEYRELYRKHLEN